MTTIANLPKIRIGVPAYNGEPFIQEALESLLAEPFTDFDLAISDNSSTNSTDAICRVYAAMDKRIRYLQEPVRGDSQIQFN